MKKSIFLVLLVYLAFLPLTSNATTKSVVIIGDSITQGIVPHYTFRHPLWENLVRAGADFDFVGSTSTSVNGGLLSCPRCQCQYFDQNHEGHWAWRADQILADLPTWLGSYTPDVVILEIGANDLVQEQSIESTEGEIEDIIDALRADNANVIILLSTLFPTTDVDVHALIDDLNADLPALVAGWTTPQSPITLVDTHTGLDPATDMYDGWHPNETGEQKIANAFFAALDGILY